MSNTPEIIYMPSSNFDALGRRTDYTTVYLRKKHETEIEYILKSKHDEEIAKLKAEIERLKKGKWISTRERLPNERIFPCLAINMDVPEYSRHIMCATYYEELGYFNDAVTNEKTIQFVTHWMPLPELPKD